MAERKIRILLGKLGKGYRESQLELAKCFGEAGFEVIYTELEDPAALVRSGLQESVDHIGITTLPGSDIDAIQEIKRILKEENADDITITAGGYLAEEDMPRINAMGIMAFFPKGTPFQELVLWSKEHIRARRD
jgi:methylmalonyl-CoA mutase C-terminal domain/subunit